MEKKTVLVLASTFPRWKDDTTPPFVFELEKRLTENFNIIVLAPHFVGAKKDELLENVRIHRFQYFWPERLQQLCYNGGIMPNIKRNKLLAFQGISLVLFELFATFRLIKKYKVDFIHAHWIIPQGIIAALIKKTKHIPFIVTTHGGDIYGLQGKYMKKIKQFVLTYASGITVVSTDIKNQMEKIEKNLPVSVIPMGVDSSLFSPNTYAEEIKKTYKVTGPLLLFVGRLAEKKGVHYLLDAMPKILEEIPSTKLLIIGEGTLKDNLEKQVETLGIKENVHFLGGIKNNLLPKYFATADIFIGPSIKTKEGDTEGLGLTFVEASLSGCIPIGTNVGGIRDVIEDNKTGFIVPEKDPQAIAEIVIRILNNNSSLKEIKDRAITSAKQAFDWKIISEKYRQLYMQLLS